MRPAPDPNAEPPGPRIAVRSFAAPARQAAPDPARRAILERSRVRLLLSVGAFALLFGAVGLKLTHATLLDPRAPRRVASAAPIAPAPQEAVSRAPITDRNGEILAISLPVTALYANPRQIDDPEAVATRLARVLPQLERERLVSRLSGERQFAYLARALTPREQQAVNDLGVAGLHFETAERRYHPQGRAAVHLLGHVDVDGGGVSGLERYHDERLRARPSEPLRSSLDVRVQLALRDAVQHAIQDFSGIGGAGVILDAHSAEVVAMVSLPDYDAAEVGTATPDQRFNRATVGVYEPGSTFKLLTAAAALEYGTANLRSSFNAAQRIRYGRFTISDFKGKNRWLTFAEVLAYSSNLGAVHMAQGYGPQRQREFLRGLGLLGRSGLDLTETAQPLAPPANGWRDINMMTIAFGHGISITPLHVANSVAPLVNGGILRTPTLLARPPGEEREGTRVISPRTSETMRRLMRLIVTDGSAKGADVPGYFVGGKTGTAQKTGPRGGYLLNKRIAAFVGAFPMQDPRYVLYVMVDEPRPNARSHGYATAGWVAAPAAGRVIARVAPILGLVPDDPASAEILAATAVPLQPGRPVVRPAVPAATPTRPVSRPAVAPAPAPAAPPRTTALAGPVLAGLGGGEAPDARGAEAGRAPR